MLYLRPQLLRAMLISSAADEMLRAILYHLWPRSPVEFRTLPEVLLCLMNYFPTLKQLLGYISGTDKPLCKISCSFIDVCFLINSPSFSLPFAQLAIHTVWSIVPFMYSLIKIALIPNPTNFSMRPLIHHEVHKGVLNNACLNGQIFYFTEMY